MAEKEPNPHAGAGPGVRRPPNGSIPHDPLARINKWLRDRVQNPNQAIPVTLLQNVFVEEKIDEIVGALERVRVKGSLIVTVRSSFWESHNYLRPIYSRPGNLTDFIEQPQNQKPFEYDLKGDSPFTGMVAKCLPAAWEDRETFAAVYALGSKGTLEANSEFGARIDNFLDNYLRSERATRQQRPHYRYCLFAGQKKGEDAGKLRLHHIVAIYFDTAETEESISQECAEAARTVARNLFDGLDLLASIDASLFRSDGLQLVADLLPEFNRPEIAPADKIAFALERLKSLLEGHLVGRHGGGAAPTVHYVAVSFERHEVKDQPPTYVPKFRLYPRIYAQHHPLGAFVVAHPKIPTAVKFLLNHYMKSGSHIIQERENALPAEADPSSMSISRQFQDLFSTGKLRTRRVNDWSGKICRAPDQLHMGQFDHLQDRNKTTPWDALNRQVDPERPNKSIAAFVVEGPVQNRFRGRGKKTRRGPPRGVLVIESERLDAFSDDDIVSLRRVVTGLSSLIRQITHANSSLDFTQAFIDSLAKQPDVGGKEKLLLSVIKFDADIFNNQSEQFDAILEKENFPTLGADLRNWIATEFPGTPNDEAQKSGVALDIIRTRRDTLVRNWAMLQEEHKSKIEDLTEILAAAPENFMWGAYLAAIPQALGDRTSSRLPTLTALEAGHSASDLMVASVGGELRQVVKLSSGDKLEKERTKYRAHVRYKLPLAARIPMNAFAVDTTGALGQKSGSKSRPREIDTTDASGQMPDGQAGPSDIDARIAAYRKTSYGALVSDLVSADTTASGASADSEIRTLLSATLDVVLLKGATSPTSEQIGGAIKEHFSDKSLSLWRRTAQPDREINFRDYVRRSMRIEGGVDDLIFIAGLDGFGSAFEPEKIKELTATVLDGKRHLGDSRSSGDLVRARTLIGTTHGDLNARNLSWSDAVDRFVLIDFEHVDEDRIHFADIARLSINLICSLISLHVSREPLRAEHSPRETSVPQVGECLSWLAGLSAQLRRGGGASLEQAITGVGSSQDRKGQHDDCVGIVRSILQAWDLAESKGGVSAGEKSVWREFIAYTLFCAALKEFDYSGRALSSDKGNLAAHAQSIVEATLNSDDASGLAYDRLIARLMDEVIGRVGRPVTARGGLTSAAAADLSRYFVSLLALRALLPP